VHANRDYAVSSSADNCARRSGVPTSVQWPR